MFDTIALTVLGLSILYSVWKGMVREIFSLVSLVAAYLLASQFFADLAGWLEDWVPGETFALILSFVLLFLAGLMGMALVGRLARKFLQSNDSISGWDRILGGLFGIAKGVLILIAFMLPLQWFDETYARWTEDSVLAPYLEGWMEELRENAAPGFAKSVPGSLKGIRKQPGTLEDVKRQVTEQKKNLEETVTALKEGDIAPMEDYTESDQKELDSLLNKIEEGYNRQKQ